MSDDAPPGEGAAEDREHEAPTFVGRGGEKLHHALREFRIDVRSRRCADLGCSTGGFTDCLLQAGASHVIAVDTAYGILAYKLRTDERVAVRERTNALHAHPPEGDERVDLVVVDLGWTPQRLIVPVALRWLKPTGDARIITLVKPHYEAAKLPDVDAPTRGVLDEARALEVTERVVEELPALGARVLGLTRSPVVGGKTRKGRARGNLEWLALLAPATSA